MAASESGIANTAERTNDSLRRTYSAGLCIGGHPTGGIPLSVENTGENGADNSQLMHNVSIARTNSSGASLRRLFSMSNSSQPQFEENLENEIVSQAGDVGDKIFSRRGSESESVRFAMEQGIVFPIPEDLLVSYGFWSRDNFNVNTISPASPLVSDIVTPPSTNALLHKKEVSSCLSLLIVAFA